MRFRGMMVALSLFTWGCGDDSGGTATDGSIDGSTPSSSDSGIHLLPDAHYSDGGPIYVGPDGAIVMIGPDGAVLPDGSATDGGAPDAVVVVPCTGTFELVSPTGAAPLFEAVRCNPTGAVATQYDWGEGSGFEATPTHRYTTPGTFTVTQKATDANSQTTQATATVTVSSFTPVRFSTTDHTVFTTDEGCCSNVTVSEDGFEFAQGNGEHNVLPAAIRSDGSISPGSGVFYFEGHRLTSEPWYRGVLGISTSPVNGPPPTYDFNGGSANHGLATFNMGDGSGASSDGGSCTGTGAVDLTQLDTGYVVDYRGSTPVLHILQGTAAALPAVLTSCVLPVSGAAFIYAGGERAQLYNELRINTGADTTNVPFHYSEVGVRAAVAALDMAASQKLVMGFGATNAGRPDSPPVLAVPSDSTAALNSVVTLTGSASDVEDGDLSAHMTWVDRSLQYHKQVPTTGPNFMFTPDKLGIHPIDVTVRDLDGVATTKRINVKVTGSLPMPNPVTLVANPDTMGAMIAVSPDGLSAGFPTYNKDAVRANQGLIDDFWYFEVHRRNPTRNLGIGLVIEDGSIDPYDFDPVPWSCSINVKGGGGAYINLILQTSIDPWQPSSGPDLYQDYGYAVDFRGSTPVAYVIIGNKVQATLKLSDTYAPVFPMLYGNGADLSHGEMMTDPFDFTINFGATPFVQDARMALSAAGLDASGLKKGWGSNVQP